MRLKYSIISLILLITAMMSLGGSLNNGGNIDGYGAPVFVQAPYAVVFPAAAPPTPATTLVLEYLYLTDAALDTSGNGYDGTLFNTVHATNGIAAWMVGNATTAYVSAGDETVFNFGDASTDSAFSLEAWVNFDVVNSQDTIMSKEGQYSLSINASGKIVFACYDNDTSNKIELIADDALIADVWYHIVATYDGSSLHTGLDLTISAEDVAETSALTGTYVAMHVTANDLQIGRYAATDYIDGNFNDTKLYSEARTVATNGVAFTNSWPAHGQLTNIVDEAYYPDIWSLETYNMQTCQDYSGKGNHSSCGDLVFSTITGDATFNGATSNDDKPIGSGYNVYSNALVYAMWFYPETTDGTFKIFVDSGVGSSQRFYGYQNTDERPHFVTGSGAGAADIAATDPVVAQTWIFLVFGSWGDGTTRLYVNGVSNSAGTVANFVLADDIRYGISQANGSPWDGKLDNTIVFTNAPSQATIDDLYNNYPNGVN